MIASDFEQLISDAGLILLSDWPPRFLVCLCVESLGQPGIRYQNETIVYTPDAFVALTPEQAKQDIANCKEQLLQAAHTQQGRTTDERAPQKQPAQKIQPSAINYPAH